MWMFDRTLQDSSKKSSEEIYREKIGDVRVRIDRIMEEHIHTSRERVECTPKKEPAK